MYLIFRSDFREKWREILWRVSIVIIFECFLRVYMQNIWLMN